MYLRLQVVVSPEEDAVALAIDPLPQMGPVVNVNSSAGGTGIQDYLTGLLYSKLLSCGNPVCRTKRLCCI